MSADLLEVTYYVAEILGVIAIIGSLLFVGRQLHQNNALLKLGAAQTMLESWLGRSDLIISDERFADIVLRSMSDPESLSDVEFYQIDVYSSAVMKVAEVTYLQWIEGNIHEGLWQGFRENVKSGLTVSEPRRKSWALRSHQFSAGFKDVIGEILLEIDQEKAR